MLAFLVTVFISIFSVLVHVV